MSEGTKKKKNMIIGNIPSRSKAHLASASSGTAASSSSADISNDASKIHRFRIVVLSPQRVGKTSLLSLWAGMPFSTNEPPTIGIDIRNIRLSHGNFPLTPHEVYTRHRNEHQCGENHIVLPRILPLDERLEMIFLEGGSGSGSTFYQRMCAPLISSANCVIVPYDVTQKSLDGGWREAIAHVDMLRNTPAYENRRPQIKSCLFCLIGTKADLLVPAAAPSRQSANGAPAAAAASSSLASQQPLRVESGGTEEEHRGHDHMRETCAAMECHFLGEVSAATGSGVGHALMKLGGLLFETKLEDALADARTKKRKPQRDPNVRYNFYGFAHKRK